MQAPQLLLALLPLLPVVSPPQKGAVEPASTSAEDSARDSAEHSASDAIKIELHRDADRHLVAARYTDAEAGFRAALQLSPDDATLTYGLCCALVGQGKLDGALPVLREALRLGYLDECVARADPDMRKLSGTQPFWELITPTRNAVTPEAAVAWPFSASRVRPIQVPSFPPVVAIPMDDGGLEIIQCADGERTKSTRACRSPISSMAASPDGATIATFHANGELVLTDRVAGTKKTIDSLKESSKSPRRSQLSYAAGGRRIVGWLGGSPMRWSASGETLGPLAPTNENSRWPALDLTQSEWIPETRGSAMSLHWLGAEPRPPLELVMPHRISGVATSPQGRYMAVGTEQGGVHLVALGTGKLLWSKTMTSSTTKTGFDLFGDPLRVPTLSFDPAAKRLAVCTTTGYYVGVFDVASGDQIWRTGHLGGRMGAPMALMQSQAHIMGDRGRFVWDGDAGERLDPDGSNWAQGLGSGFAILDQHVYFADENELCCADALARKVLWRVARPKRMPLLVEHPSGWIGGTFDTLETSIDPRTYDPKRLRLAKKGLRLSPPNTEDD